MTTGLSAGTLIFVIIGYFLLLMLISHFTSKNATNEIFFNAKKESPWFLVAFGMIGATLSGVTFISIPGAVGAGGKNMSFSYMQVVMGYMVGYFIIATVLMPLYYKLNLTTIYGYLEQRFGKLSYKTGAAFFLLSRVIGASFRLFLVAIVLQKFIMDAYGIPFFITVMITIILIWIYTFRAGIKTIVWTDTLQTLCMLTALILTIFSIGDAMNLDLSEMISKIKSSNYSQMFYWEGGWSDPNNFYKQFFSGALIAIVMTGLDQDMMQKNLTCKSLADAQKNMFAFSFVLIFAKLLFIALGAMLYIYAIESNIVIPQRSDQLYPSIALHHLSPFIGITFLLGLIAAAYSSADSALTALTTSFCIDFLDFEKRSDIDELAKKSRRIKVHIAFSLILLVVINIFYLLDNEAIINQLFTAAGYTYGPILGLFLFGMITKRKIRDKYTLIVCLIAPLLTWVLNTNSQSWFNGFTFGFLLIALNGILTFVGLWIISFNKNQPSIA